MADCVQIDTVDPPLAPPLQLNGNFEPSTPPPNSSDEGRVTLEDYPQSNGDTVKKLANRRVETLRSTGDHVRRRSPRLTDSAADERSGMEVNSPELDGPDENYPPIKKHKSGKKTSFFIGEPVPEDEARRRWAWRYEDTEVCATVMWFDLLVAVFLHGREL